MKLERMEADYLGARLRELLEIPSPTGYTDTIVRHVSAELDRLGIPYELTRRGAIRAVLRGHERNSARAIVSHVDTIGAQIRALQPNGRAALVPVGTWSARFAEGARTTIFTQKGTYRGTILPLKASGHAFGDDIDLQPIGWDHIELRVDAPATNADELKQLGVEVGDMVAIDPQPEFLDNGFIVSRHLDNKAGVAVMLSALRALVEGPKPPVDIFWLFTISEEVGHGASSILLPDIASLVAVDNGTAATGQNSSEFGVTVCMADVTGPFDFHLTRKLVDLCVEHGLQYQKDVFRHYRSDSASAVEAGADVRTALVTFGVDASHGYERIHMHALRSLAELLRLYASSEVKILRDKAVTGGLKGFTRQPSKPADQELSAESDIHERPVEDG